MLKIVFASTTAMVSVGPGNHTTVHVGEHWPADDPIVKAHPDLFTADPRFGLRVSVPLDEDAELLEDEALNDAWVALVHDALKAGINPEDVLMVAKSSAAGRAAVAAKELDEQPTPATEERAADAGQSQAPVEQATKAPGEKSNARRQGTRRA